MDKWSVKRVNANFMRFMYNLVSVSKAVEAGKVVEFNKTSSRYKWETDHSCRVGRKPVKPELSD